MRQTQLTLLAALAVATALFAGFRACLPHRVAAEDVLAKPWIEQRIDAITVSAPWPLRRTTLPIGEDERKTLIAYTTAGHGDAALTVSVSHFAYAAGQQPSPDTAAERSLTALRRIDPNLNGRKFETRVAGSPAMEIGATMTNADDAPSYAHGVFFSDHGDAYEVLMICRTDQPRAAEVWQELRASIKRP